MKILKVEFENLNSLRGTQTINLEFGELAEAGIFAICLLYTSPSPRDS